MAQPYTAARVQQLAQKPATRHSIPTGILEKYGLTKYVRARAMYQPVVPGGQMTQGDLARAANAAVQTQFGPTQQLYQRQAQMAPQYFNNYAQTLKDAATAQQAQAQQAGQSIQTLYSSGPHAPGSQQANVGAAQAGTANLLGQAQTNYLNRLAAGAQAQGLANRNMALQKGANLAQQMGAANVQERQRLAQQEFQNVATANLTNLNLGKAQVAAQQGQERIDIQQQRAQSSAGTARANRIRQDQVFAASHGGFTPSQFSALPSSKQISVLRQVRGAGSGGPGSGKDQFGNTPVQRQSRTSAFRNILRNARQLHARQPGLGVEDVLTAIGPDYSNADADVLTGAVEMATLGRVGPHTAGALQRLGVDQTYWGAPAPRRVVKRTGPAVAPGPAGTTGTRPT